MYCFLSDIGDYSSSVHRQADCVAPEMLMRAIVACKVIDKAAIFTEQAALLTQLLTANFVYEKLIVILGIDRGTLDVCLQRTKQKDLPIYPAVALIAWQLSAIV